MESKQLEFNIYDMLVFEDEAGGIHQDYVRIIKKELSYNEEKNTFTDLSVFCGNYIIDVDGNRIDSIFDIRHGKTNLPDLTLKEIWTRVNEDTYKRVWMKDTK